MLEIGPMRLFFNALVLSAMLFQTPLLGSETIIDSYSVLDIDTCINSITLDRIPRLHLRAYDQAIIHVSASQTIDGNALTSAIHLVSVDTCIGVRLFLRNDLSHIPITSNRIQLVIPIVSDEVHPADTISCMPWNGHHGGVVAIVGKHARFDRNYINASHRGFRGGLQRFPTADTIQDSLQLDWYTHGETFTFRTNDNQGKVGLARNGGASGGGRITPGGQGGATSNVYLPVREGSISKQHNRPFSTVEFGSGGGAGHGNDLSRTDGGRGGGVVVIISDTVTLDAMSVIDASGQHAHSTVADGGGGGGAGGAIVILSSQGTIKARLTVAGGNGGDVTCGEFRSGPGGGGAGGLVSVIGALIDESRVATNGGIAGVILGTNDTRGSQRGGDGTVVAINSDVHIEPLHKPTTVLLTTLDSIVNYGESTTIRCLGATNCTWLDKDVVQSISDPFEIVTPPITGPRWFRVRTVTSKGCVHIDSIRVRPRIASQSLLVEADNIRATPGDTTDVFIRWSLSMPLADDIQGFAVMSTHSAVAHAVRTNYRDRERSYIRMPFSLEGGDRSTFRRERFAVVLGDSLSVQLRIDSVVVTNTTLPIRKRHGRLTLDSICVAGDRTRLFDARANVFRVIGRKIEAEADEVHITDLSGKQVPADQSVYGNTITATIHENIRGPLFITLLRGETVTTQRIWLE